MPTSICRQRQAPLFCTVASSEPPAWSAAPCRIAYELQRFSIWQQCYSGAISNAVSTVDSPRLTSIHGKSFASKNLTAALQPYPARAVMVPGKTGAPDSSGTGTLLTRLHLMLLAPSLHLPHSLDLFQRKIGPHPRRLASSMGAGTNSSATAMDLSEEIGYQVDDLVIDIGLSTPRVSRGDAQIPLSTLSFGSAGVCARGPKPSHFQPVDRQSLAGTGRQPGDGQSASESGPRSAGR